MSFKFQTRSLAFCAKNDNALYLFSQGKAYMQTSNKKFIKIHDSIFTETERKKNSAFPSIKDLIHVEKKNKIKYIQ